MTRNVRKHTSKIYAERRLKSDPRILTKIFIVRMKKFFILIYTPYGSEDFDQTVWLRWLIRIFARHTYLKLRFLNFPVSILYKSLSGRYRPVSYPDGPKTARYIFIKNAG